MDELTRSATVGAVALAGLGLTSRAFAASWPAIMQARALFSSDRERRFWLWTLVVVVAIYSTLGFARTLAEVLREHGLLEAFSVGMFLLGMFLVGATIVTQGVKARVGGAEIAVALGVTAAYLMVFFRMAIAEERTHLIEYGVVGVFIYEALTERANHGRRVPLPPLLAVLATAALGLIGASRRFCPAASSTHRTSCSTCSRARWRWGRASRWRGRGG